MCNVPSSFLTAPCTPAQNSRRLLYEFDRSATITQHCGAYVRSRTQRKIPLIANRAHPAGAARDRQSLAADSTKRKTLVYRDRPRRTITTRIGQQRITVHKIQARLRVAHSGGVCRSWREGGQQRVACRAAGLQSRYLGLPRHAPNHTPPPLTCDTALEGPPPPHLA